mmetsp:Transcript_22940/g.46580  ORF Transcript_22940/g.46580 Transcript_22940/m.46580 type:complete len:241 (+) Transcript_22940:161-883(+)
MAIHIKQCRFFVFASFLTPNLRCQMPHYPQTHPRGSGSPAILSCSPKIPSALPITGNSSAAPFGGGLSATVTSISLSPASLTMSCNTRNLLVRSCSSTSSLWWTISRAGEGALAMLTSISATRISSERSENLAGGIGASSSEEGSGVVTVPPAASSLCLSAMERQSRYLASNISTSREAHPFNIAGGTSRTAPRPVVGVSGVTNPPLVRHSSARRRSRDSMSRRRSNSALALFPSPFVVS